MKQKYIVKLTETERSQLKELVSSDEASAQQIRRAYILLKSDSSAGGPKWKYQAICKAYDVSQLTVNNVRKKYIEGGLERAILRKKPDRMYERRLDDEGEAYLIALACGEPPDGYERWSLRLLKDRIIRLEIAENISHETIRQTLKKNKLKPWLKEQWWIPPQANAAFVCDMEDILEVYTQPADPKRPLVCMDEVSKQLLSDIRDPIPAQPGQLERFDYEYQRQGVANMFMFFEPFRGQRHVKVTNRRTRLDWAEAMRELSDEIHPEAEKIVVVLNNLNTHNPASFYVAFELDEARRLVERFEFHFTPKHGSWLNMAKIELSVLSRQHLKRRIPDELILNREIQAWTSERNSRVVKVDWRFSTADARIKLKHLYPEIHD